jgi:hypothetical protein
VDGCGDGHSVVGKPQSVTERDFRALRLFPCAECDREYDRVLLVDGRLFFGARPVDGFVCTLGRRPVMVGTQPLVRSAR